MNNDTRKVLLLASILLNVVLIVLFVWFVGYSRKTMLTLVADAAGNQIALQERILEDLSSGDAARISAMTNSLYWSLDAQKRLRYKIETKAY